jgi:hypothetical protein
MGTSQTITNKRKTKNNERQQLTAIGANDVT